MQQSFLDAFFAYIPEAKTDPVTKQKIKQPGYKSKIKGSNQDSIVYWASSTQGITIDYNNGAFYVSCGALWNKSNPQCPSHMTFVLSTDHKHLTLMGGPNGAPCKTTRKVCQSHLCWTETLREDSNNQLETNGKSIPSWHQDYKDTLGAGNTFWTLYRNTLKRNPVAYQLLQAEIQKFPARLPRGYVLPSNQQTANQSSTNQPVQISSGIAQPGTQPNQPTGAANRYRSNNNSSNIYSAQPSVFNPNVPAFYPGSAGLPPGLNSNATSFVPASIQAVNTASNNKVDLSTFPISELHVLEDLLFDLEHADQSNIISAASDVQFFLARMRSRTVFGGNTRSRKSKKSLKSGKKTKQIRSRRRLVKHRRKSSRPN